MIHTWRNRQMKPVLPQVAAVVVSHSHDETLPSVIAALLRQTRPPDGIIVINQGGTRAGRPDVLSNAGLIVIDQDNLGSAGGFCRGIRESIQRGFEWTWIFDDDAIPEDNALEELVNCRYFRAEDTVFVASRIVDQNGRTYMSPGGSTSQAWYGTVLEDKCIEAVDGCWPGLLVRSSAVLAAGLPVAEFFFYEEDREFITRLAGFGRGYCVLTSVVKHMQANRSFDPFGTDFLKAAYLTRNRIARRKLSGSFGLRLRRVLRETASALIQVATGKLPLRILPWIFKGAVLFNPKIQYLQAGPTISHPQPREVALGKKAGHEQTGQIQR